MWPGHTAAVNWDRPRFERAPLTAILAAFSKATDLLAAVALMMGTRDRADPTGNGRFGAKEANDDALFPG